MSNLLRIMAQSWAHPYRNPILLLWAGIALLLGVMAWQQNRAPIADANAEQLPISSAYQPYELSYSAAMQWWKERFQQKVAEQEKLQQAGNSANDPNDSDLPQPLEDATKLDTLWVRVGAVFLDGNNAFKRVALIESQQQSAREIEYQRIRVGDLLGSYQLTSMTTHALTFQLTVTNTDLDHPATVVVPVFAIEE